VVAVDLGYSVVVVDRSDSDEDAEEVDWPRTLQSRNLIAILCFGFSTEGVYVPVL